MKETVGAILPGLLGARLVQWKIIDHGSKRALLNFLPARLQGYARLPHPRPRILVLVDRDDDDCHLLKQFLEDAALKAGLNTKTKPALAGYFEVVNRIVIEELEAWFLGDVPALCSAYRGVPPTLGSRAPFRNPDNVAGGTWEALHRILKTAGHYGGSQRLPKIEVARRVAHGMVPNRNRSHSFQVFVSGLEALLT